MTRLARNRSHEDFLEETAAVVNANEPPDIQKLKAVLAKHGLAAVIPPATWQHPGRFRTSP
jgi:hypothetical protein